MNTPLWAEVAAALRERGVEVGKVRRALDPDTGADATVDLRAPAGSVTYAVHIRGDVAAATLGRIATGGSRVLLVAPYVRRREAAACRDLGIEFADAAGNMYLDLPGLRIEVEGRPATARTARGRAERVFQPSGLRIVFALLCEPRLLDEPFRAIAAEARTSLGTVHIVTKALAEMSFLEDLGRSRRLHYSRRLFDRWVEAYDTTLRPKLSLGWFESDDPAALLHAEPRDYAALWGGETAAARLTKHLRTGSAIIYADSLPRELLMRFRLRRVTRGGFVEFRERFWGEGVTGTRPDCVPTPLVYADLVASAEPRQVEVAQRLRESDATLRRIDAG